MKSLVVDASVVIKWFVPEIHSIAAARLLDPEFNLSAPDLLGPEVANTVWKKVRREEIAPDDALQILNALGNLGVEVYPSNVLLASALRVALALDRTVYDSLYLALAVAQDSPLITADRKFYTTVIASPLSSHIRWIEDAV